MIRLAIVTTHPIQYNAPLFKLLNQSKALKLKVFYTWGQSQQGLKYEPGFGKEIKWDIPLLEDYEYCFVKNTSRNPGSHHFNGIITPSLNNEILAWNPTAILVYGWSFLGHLNCIRYFHKRLPVIFRGDSTLIGEKCRIKALLRLIFLKWVYAHIDYALYVGKNNKDYFLRHGLKEFQLILAYHAIDNDRFSEPNEHYHTLAAEERLKHGILKDDIVLLFAGKFDSNKNPFFLLEIARRIKDRRLKILFVGNGILEKELKNAASSDQRVIFKDFCNQSQMPIIYRMGDIFILPSHGETWGLAANEAMASGLAVMISDKAGSAADLVDEPLNGISFDNMDIEKCVRFLQRLLQNTNELASMKKVSQERIRNFSFNNIIQSIESLLKIDKRDNDA